MKRLGIIGTMVWDTIWREAAGGSHVEEGGGISYALAAADASCPPDFSVRPIIKMGRDLAERGFDFLRDLSAIESHEAISVTAEPNTRVELSYRSSERRLERIGGHIPTWKWAELEPRLAGVDALYINFITGCELELETAQRIRYSFDGIIYADIHSLMLAIGPGGERSLQPLEDCSDWLACFDVVQLNEDELKALSSHWGDPWACAADIVGRDTKLLLVTLGSRGAAYIVAPDALPFDRERSLLDPSGPVRSGRVAGEAMAGGDPTGCGDVFGITVFCELLQDRKIEAALRTAAEAARRNVVHRGATGLNSYLKGEFGRV